MTIASQFHEIATGIWSWSAYDEDVRTDLFSTAVLAEDGLVVIDPILLTVEAMNKLGRLGPVAAIVITNGNHTRACSTFRESLSAPVFAHQDAVGELTAPVDGSLRTTRKVGGSLEVLELYGAGAGEVALYDSRGMLHLGDAIIRTEKHGLEILPEKYCADAAGLKKSLGQLKGKAFHLATFAHGVPLTLNAGEQMARFFE